MPTRNSWIRAREKQIATLEGRIARLQSEINARRKRDSAMTIKEVARMFGVSGTTVIRMIHDGRLKAFRLVDRGWWWVTKRSIQQLHKRIAEHYTPRSQGASTDI